ncbi:MAG: hypothetical protein HY913_00765 [Desulfomonile tiedjei]|nr:hypothetical protein [Desulfomonile tiedjei]
MLIKDLFNEILRRLEWSKDRGLEPSATQSLHGFVVKIPVEKSVAYVVKIDEVTGKGALIRSYFPDGEPHHCIGMEGTSPEEAASLINAAALLVYGRLITRKEQERGPQ